MRQGSEQTVLFLCTDNYLASRFAEVLFNSVAARMGLPWHASARRLGLERGPHSIAPLAPSAIKALDALGVAAVEACTRVPEQAAVTDLDNASLIIALKQDERLPLLQECFPTCVDKVEFWQVADAADALAGMEQKVMQLIARLFGGTRAASAGETIAPSKLCPKCRQPHGSCACNAKKAPMPGAAVVKVGRETKGRRGKGVTTVWDLPLDEAGVRELAGKLKERCGTGGTVKDGRIEIQGDQRERIASELQKLGYKVKRVGG